jgi:hypothetical protein
MSAPRMERAPLDAEGVASSPPFADSSTTTT